MVRVLYFHTFFFSHQILKFYQMGRVGPSQSRTENHHMSQQSFSKVSAKSHQSLSNVSAKSQQSLSNVELAFKQTFIRK